MHILLGALSAIVTVLYILDRLGVDIGWYNPWSWRRRRAWAKKYDGDPVYSVEDPIHAAAILVTGVARLDGDPSQEQKKAIRNLFGKRFSLNEKEAAGLLASASHLLGAPQIVDMQLSGLAGKLKDSFSPEQARSILEMMDSVAVVGGGPTPVQQEYLARMRGMLAKPEVARTWG
jgi:uncharacterized tellurite resistance protein B-like protein